MRSSRILVVAVTKTVTRTGARAVAWFDDMAVRMTLTHTLERAGLRPAVLVISPDEYIRITLRQVRRAAQFVNDIRGDEPIDRPTS